MASIAVVGSTNIDMVAYTDQLPERGETVTGKDFAIGFGGKGANQAVIAAIDVKKNFFGKYEVVSKSATQKHKSSVIEWAKEMENRGAGEILLTSVDREGTWSGFDLDLIKSITSVVNIPVIANGGAGNVNHIIEGKKTANASALALGSMLVYQKQGMGVLINYPDRKKLEKDLQ